MAHAGFVVEQKRPVLSQPAGAAEADIPEVAPQIQPVISPRAPVTLKADIVEYDQKNDVVLARGQVEIAQGGSVVLADRVVYDQARNQVQAQGNISMLEPSGNVYFADSLEFQDDLKTGLIRQFRARLSDDSVFAANGGRKLDENTTELYRAAYTPCNCATDEGEPKTPLWSIRADRATIDQQEQKVTYDDASLQVYGLPVLYTPYFSHPTPDADNQSGLLPPEFMQNKQLGATYKQPVYYTIAPDRDVTVTPMLTTKEGPVMAGEYRQQFDKGALNLGGSVTSAENRDARGDRIPGRETRGHFDGSGDFKHDDSYGWGFRIRRASDDTYLHRYNFNSDTLLTSRVYGEGLNFIDDGDRNYGSVEALSFQGLTGQDSTSVIPVVLPLAGVTWQSEPGLYDSRLGLEANVMALHRKTGDESRRLLGIARWDLPYITDDGQIIELDAQMRADIYDVDGVRLSSSRNYSGATGRAVPQASLTWRAPFINRFDDASILLEPIVSGTVSPGGGNPEKIPNNDSLLPDFTDANLFSANRFAGYDRIENGPRMSYGLRGQGQHAGYFADWLFGQQYRVINDPNFPISNDPTDHFSDYVGKFGLDYAPVSLHYRFRLDKHDFAVHRNEITAALDYYPVNLSATYLALRNDSVLSDREVAAGNASLNLTRQWSLTANGSHDLERNQTVSLYSGLGYKNECIGVTTMVGKDYTNLLDIEPSLTFWLRVSLKNLD